MSDIDFGQISEALNDKTDRDMRNVDNTAGTDAVVEYQEPTAGNNYTWYRKYKSGWVEQGGKTTSSNNASVTLPIVMSDANYTVVVAKEHSESVAVGVAPNNITSTGFQIKICYDNSLAREMYWQVSGMAAN